MLTPLAGAITKTPYRDLAKLHAREASRILLSAEESDSDEEQLDLLTAIAHALTSIAASGVAPVARQRLIPCTTKAGAK